MSCPLSGSLVASRMGDCGPVGVSREEEAGVPMAPGLESGVLGGRWMDGPPPSLLQAPVAPATVGRCWPAAVPGLVGPHHSRKWWVCGDGHGSLAERDVPCVSFSASAVSFFGVHAREGNHETGWIL